MPELTLSDLKEAVGGTAAAFRCATSYQPVGGAGDKIFPPTYEGGRYATENRVNPETGDITHCVLLDSVQSQANRMELALLEAYRRQKIQLPLMITSFDDDVLTKKFTVSSLEAPHRIADALFRDSLLDGMIFRKSDKGRVLDTAEVRNATGLFGLCPMALVFGVWDSTGPRGGLGAKFQRALVSEIIGYGAQAGVKTSSRIDPAQIRLGAGTLYERKGKNSDAPHWTLDKDKGDKKLGEKSKAEDGQSGKKGKVAYGKPAQANHGNVTPGIADGGFTVSKAVQTTVLSITTLRRMRFPLNGVAASDPETDLLAHTTLAALGLAAATLAQGDGDLRSRCHLFPLQQPVWELLDRPGAEPVSYELTPESAITLLNEAVSAAKSFGLPWEGEIALKPSDELLELVRLSQELAAGESASESG